MQQTLERKHIPQKFHRFAQDALTPVPIPILRRQRISTKFIAKKISKFAPRYIKELSINYLINLKLVKALKRVKVIDSVSEASSSDPIGDRWRTALQNKFKSIREYKPNPKDWKAIERYKAFPNMINVVLCDEITKKSLKKTKKKISASFLWNLLKWIPGMTNIRSLDFELDVATNPAALKRFNKLIPKLSSSLKSFRISNVVCPVGFWVHNEFILTSGLSYLVENKSILEHITRLDLCNIDEKAFPKNFEMLSKGCKNLMFLSMGFRGEYDLECLRILKDFETLRGVSMSSQNFSGFIENFTLPCSIKDVEICFSSIFSNNFYKKFLSTGKIDEKLASFCEKWTKLSQLASLKISAMYVPAAMDLIQSFCMMILKSIPNLVNFQFHIFDNLVDEFCENNDENKQNLLPIDLNDFFRALNKFSNQMERVEISYPENYGFTWISNESLNFPKLTLLQLGRNPILNVETISNLFCAVQKPNSTDKVKIIFESLIVDSNSTLMNLIQTLKKSPRNSTTELVIEMKSNFEISEEFSEKEKTGDGVQNVHLTVQIDSDFYDERVKALSFLEEIFANVFFEIVEKYDFGYYVDNA